MKSTKASLKSKRYTVIFKNPMVATIHPTSSFKPWIADGFLQFDDGTMIAAVEVLYMKEQAV